jgi:O-antigen/teichoic acid export membrane protein
MSRVTDPESDQRSDQPTRQSVGDLSVPADEHAHVSRGTARLVSAAATRQLIGTALLAVTAAIVARSLGAGEFGLYASGTAAYYLADAFVELGFGIVAAREMAKRPGEEWPLLRSTTEVQLVWSAVTAVGLLALGIGTGGVRGQVMIVLSPAILIGGLGTARQLFSVRYRALPLLIVDLISVAVQAIAMSILALLGAGALALAGVLSAVACLNTIAVFVLALRMLDRPRVVSTRRLEILRMAIPIGIASLLSSLYFTIDQVILGWLVTSHELGYYAAAVKLLSMVVAVPGFIMAAGIPALSRSAHDRRSLSRHTAMLAHWLAVTGFPLAIGLMVFARPAITLAFGHAYAPAIPLLRILMLAASLSLVANVLGNVLLSSSIVRALVLVNLASLVVNVVGNIVLAPVYGVTASAWLTVASELIVISYGAVALRHRVSYTTVLARVWRPVVATLCGAAVGVLLGADTWYAIALGCITYLLGLAALRAWPAELVPPRFGRIAIAVTR